MIRTVKRVGQKAGKKPQAFFAVRGAWGRGRARQSNCDSNLSPLFVGGFPRFRIDFVKSIILRLKGWGQGGLPVITALLLTPDISCSKSNSCSRLCLLRAAFSSCSACCSALLMLFCLRAMCKLGLQQVFYLLFILLCNASALLPACHVQTRPAAGLLSAFHTALQCLCSFACLLCANSACSSSYLYKVRICFLRILSARCKQAIYA